MTDKEQKSAEVAQETAAFGQKSTEVLELQRRIAEHLQRIKSTATLAQYAPASQAMRETLHGLAHHATEALKALEVINSGAKMALERFIHIKDGNLIISRSQWIYPHATTEFAGPRDEDRYAAIGHRDGDICLSFHGAHIDAADAAIMLSAAPQQEAQEPATGTEIAEAIDFLVRAAWDWGESCGVDSVPWGAAGDSFNDSRRDATEQAKRRLLLAFISVLGNAIYTAPQPAPAPLSDDVVKDAARYVHLIETRDDQQHGKPTLGAAWDDDIGFWRSGSFFSLNDKASIDAAIDAALAAQGSK